MFSTQSLKICYKVLQKQQTNSVYSHQYSCFGQPIMSEWAVILADVLFPFA